MKLKVMAFTGELFETDIDMADIDSMIVKVLAGDEVVIVNLKDGTQRRIDADKLSGYGRTKNDFEGSYGVHPSDFEEWAKRKETDEWLHMFDT